MIVYEISVIQYFCVVLKGLIIFNCSYLIFNLLLYQFFDLDLVFLDSLALTFLFCLYPIECFSFDLVLINFFIFLVGCLHCTDLCFYQLLLYYMQTLYFLKGGIDSVLCLGFLRTEALRRLQRAFKGPFFHSI